MATLRQKIEKEQVVREEPAIWVDSASIMQNGRLILTKKHLLFVLNESESVAIAIDLDTVNTLAQESLVTDPNILSITYLQYDNAKFSVLNYDEWEKAIEDTRMTPNI